MRALLISTYDLGRQPFGLASPAAWLCREGVEVECVDTSRDPLRDDQIRGAGLVAFYLPMHTATRLAAPLVERVRRVNPDATLIAYGLYAPLNGTWLEERGVAHVLGPEAEGDLAAIATRGVPETTAKPACGERAARVEPARGERATRAEQVPRLTFIQPERAFLPPLQRYAALQMPDGTRRLAGATDATRGCKHLCRHCPIVPVYAGTFRVVPVDVVMSDIDAQVEAGAQHISFGDPDFFNGPAHARKIAEQVARRHPGLTYDVTIKIEHLLRHGDLLPLLRDTGCLFITSAVESIDDAVLARLRKGHTRADFLTAVASCRQAGVALSPTFVPFTPWTTRAGYVELLEQLAALELESAVAPIQLGIRLLVTAQSALLDLPDVRDIVERFDGDSLTWPWRHRDPDVDALQRDVMRLVDSMRHAPRANVFAAVVERATGSRPCGSASRPTPPFLTEAWYCCAEPIAEYV